MSRAVWSLEARARPGADEELEDLPRSPGDRRGNCDEGDCKNELVPVFGRGSGERHSEKPQPMPGRAGHLRSRVLARVQEVRDALPHDAVNRTPVAMVPLQELESHLDFVAGGDGGPA